MLAVAIGVPSLRWYRIARQAPPLRPERSRARRRRRRHRARTPYDLRHSFASLPLHEGRSVIYVARQLGHGARLTLGTYGHVIDELDDRLQQGAAGGDHGVALAGSCRTVAASRRL